jgi:hypothetical protein
MSYQMNQDYLQLPFTQLACVFGENLNSCINLSNLDEVLRWGPLATTQVRRNPLAFYFRYIF